MCRRPSSRRHCASSMQGSQSPPLPGSTSLLISPGAQSISSLVGQVTGASQLLTDPAALLSWTGSGTHRLSWELVDFNGDVPGDHLHGECPAGDRAFERDCPFYLHTKHCAEPTVL